MRIVPTQIKLMIVLIVCLMGSGWNAIWAGDTPPATASAQPAADKGLEEILAGVEKRYSGCCFSADFYQASTLQAMDITDTATGRIYIKRPNKMRWEYGTPEKQTIITDGIQLWMYRPEDKQVMVGQAPTFFGDGKGAGFLADMQSIRANFVITQAPSDDLQAFHLQLIPVKPQPGLADIYLSISKKTYEVAIIITHNEYKDETRIELKGYQFDQQFDDALFKFEAPPGVDVLQLDEQ